MKQRVSDLTFIAIHEAGVALDGNNYAEMTFSAIMFQMPGRKIG